MVQVDQQGQISSSQSQKDTADNKPARREKVIADFSNGKSKHKGTKKSDSQEKKQPISRERNYKLDESKKDEDEMNKNIPITQRMQRKEEEAIGKTDDHKSFSERLEEVSDGHTDVLLSMTTLFPFDLFPDYITIDPIKVQIKKRIFFSSQKIRSVLVKDILDSYVEEGPLMAVLKITTSDDKDHPVRIAPLRKNDAEKAMKIIQGLVIARSESPDVGKVEAIR